MNLYVVVPTYNRISVFREFIRQLNSQVNQHFFLVVVDHGQEKTNYKSENCIVIESNVNGWSYAINVGIRYVLSVADESDYILIINDDVLMDQHYIETIHDLIRHYPQTVIGSICYESGSGRTLHVNMKLNYVKAKFDYLNKGIEYRKLQGKIFDSDVLKGRGTIYPVGVFKKIGVFAEEKLPHYRADHEMAWRAKKQGYEVCVSGDLALGAILDSPHVFEKRFSIHENYKRLFKDMISTHNTKDLWNFAFCCFSPGYALYYFINNWIKDHVCFIYKVLRI